MFRALALSEQDNVATLLTAGRAGERIAVKVKERTPEVTLLQDIPFGHKCAIAPIPKGAVVYKYGEPIGVASADIAPGQHAHVHNIAGARGRGDLSGR